jgi:pimeloyl-ACP methyl ester carboxylesterase
MQVFGQTIRYYDHGRGEPLLLVYGLGTDADVWACCLEPLSRAHRVIAPDLLGFGRSSKPLINYRLATFVEVVDRCLRVLALPRVSIVGKSMGAWISASFALRFPARVNRLILNDAIGIVAGAVQVPIDLRPSSLQNMRDILEFMFYDRALVTDELVQMSYQLHLERNDGPTIAAMWEAIQQQIDFLDDQLHALKTPTLLLWGDTDRVSPLSVAKEFRRRIKGSRLEVVPKCGHIPALEKPQEFVRGVLDFLAE